ncbi:TRAP transporter small permease [Rhizobiales bacterium]|uniref:TRAP transporter small permease subunit n=1 Tax=Hongsoonwoonella zoysiae TaxID=2821844 RepID=UPI00155FBEC1|nr:TRAP transporter small permease [Hongsoonwoonella zoysiae]NRG19496.1 TRAP transporter small permease [Hongsoonwoonella zoysiae]
MPTLTPSGYAWVAAIGAGLLLWMIFLAPRLMPVLTRSLHGQAPPPLTVVDRITLAVSSVLMFFVAVITTIMMFEVVLRYVFEAPTLWVEELSRWLGGVIFLVAGLYAMQQRSHIRVVILYEAVPRDVQRVMDVAATLCICVFCWAVAWGYWGNALRKFEAWELYGSAWNPPIPAIMKPLICITCVWMSVQAINNLIVDWRRAHAIVPAEDA